MPKPPTIEWIEVQEMADGSLFMSDEAIERAGPGAVAFAERMQGFWEHDAGLGGYNTGKWKAFPDA